MQKLKKISNTWSGIPVADFGPTKETKMARILDLAWTDADFKTELIENPNQVLENEDVFLPESLKVIVLQETENEFVFVVPAIPPKEEFYYRYEQISGWWMFAHQLWYWMAQTLDLEKARALREGLTIQLIGRSWNDEGYRKLLIDNPKQALEQEGLVFPETLEIISKVNTDRLYHLPLPKHPKEVAWDKNGTNGSWFTNGHTLWWWLVSSRLMEHDKGTVSGLVG
ncbi:hypothetical protein J8281_06615 [Aquimarina sp. U1-2]|uniref:hypothetical protein n=1 Tax=Aquimarina sp. U1-2 TaxID=2823141 RepID=UPI001AECE63C|nr:hypothetical protein [Aquimarina sp. U1-2]MBP2831858.1 hypothetical protein [Aquimarina sp. U1-2]